MLLCSLTNFIEALLMLLAVFLPYGATKPRNSAGSSIDDPFAFQFDNNDHVTHDPPSITGKSTTTSGDNACTSNGASVIEEDENPFAFQFDFSGHATRDPSSTPGNPKSTSGDNALTRPPKN